MPGKEWYAPGIRFTCTQCGNCCTGPPGYVLFEEDDAAAIARHLKISLAEFYEKYTHDLGPRRSLGEVRSQQGCDCVFLRRDEKGKALCSIYSVRPQQCRTWPFWSENLASRRAYERAGKNCPGMQKGLQDEGRFIPVEKIRVLRDSTPAL